MTGWQDVLAEVVQERRPALVGYAYLFTADRSRAEDLVHDALVRTAGRPRTLTDVHTAEGYVRQVIRTLFLDSARRQTSWRARLHLLAEDHEVPSPERSVATGLDVRAALAGLSPRERACVVLRHVDDLTVADVAAELNLSTGAVKRYLSDGTAKLRAALGPDAVRSDPTVATLLTVPRPGRTAR
ncbi:sigma-70 family RNA polymerase sigma factor [Cellulomonas cellasea]|uniref:RNA polymerase sigma-70 factor (ECF subfamily) n=1 Tax=Cellulomonas cellasea TaxID=43670 RepID=A0A7W4UG64_9CELL|nr:sigma-70 family RNA polymerase sigma factor [Cellulomonas cellasea]MBB2923577.1 RNA polymerase sigma-70 factor (ECF subfamily) [Cellulomonas cellasea]